MQRVEQHVLSLMQFQHVHQVLVKFSHVILDGKIAMELHQMDVNDLSLLSLIVGNVEQHVLIPMEDLIVHLEHVYWVHAMEDLEIVMVIHPMGVNLL